MQTVLSEIQQAQVVKRLTAFCESRVPLAMRDKLRVEVSDQGNEVVLFQAARLPPTHEWREMPSRQAEVRCDSGECGDCCCQRYRARWHAYEALPGLQASGSYSTRWPRINRDILGVT